MCSTAAFFSALKRKSSPRDGRERFDLFGSLPDTIEAVDKKLNEYIDVQKRVNGFDLRYSEQFDAEEDEWRNCTEVLSSIDALMRKGW